MNFKILYDVASEKVNLFCNELPAIYLFFILGIIVLIVYKRNNRKPKNIKLLFIGLIFTIGSPVVLWVSLIGQLRDINKAKEVISNKTFFVVEGTPINYFPFPKDGHGTERFDINGVHFAYSDYILRAAGYHNATSLGGVIFPDKYYRLTYYTLHDDLDSNKILKIEIRQ